MMQASRGTGGGVWRICPADADSPLHLQQGQHGQPALCWGHGPTTGCDEGLISCTSTLLRLRGALQLPSAGKCLLTALLDRAATRALGVFLPPGKAAAGCRCGNEGGPCYKRMLARC